MTAATNNIDKLEKVSATARAVGALNFGTIAAAASVDVVVAVSGADATYGYLASPQFAVPAGITWCAYWDGAASAVKVRCSNCTAAGVAVSGAFVVDAFKLA